MFKTIANEIFLENSLSDDFETAKNQILKAIKNGNNIIVNRLISKNLPEFYIQNNILIVKSPVKCDIRILKNGEEYFSCNDRYIKLQIYEGKYRVELTLNGKGFMYSNPIIVK